MIKFEYDGKIYAPADLDKKLKKLGITKDDITIIEEIETKSEKITKQLKNEQSSRETEIAYYYWDTLTKGWLIRNALFDSKDVTDNRLHEGRFMYIGQIDKSENYKLKIRQLWEKANNIGTQF